MARQEEIKQQISELREYFEKNLNNKYVKNIILKLDLSINVKHDMNIILDYKTLYFDSKGSIEDIYSSIKALTCFIKEVRSRVLPNIYNYTGTSFFSGTDNKNPNDKVLFQMAVKNYPMNIKILTKMTCKLFEMLIEYDDTNFTGDPAYKQVKNIDELSFYLKQSLKEDIKEKYNKDWFCKFRTSKSPKHEQEKSDMKMREINKAYQQIKKRVLV